MFVLINVRALLVHLVINTNKTNSIDFEEFVDDENIEPVLIVNTLDLRHRRLRLQVVLEFYCLRSLEFLEGHRKPVLISDFPPVSLLVHSLYSIAIVSWLILQKHDISLPK